MLIGDVGGGDSRSIQVRSVIMPLGTWSLLYRQILFLNGHEGQLKVVGVTRVN